MKTKKAVTIGSALAVLTLLLIIDVQAAGKPQPHKTAGGIEAVPAVITVDPSVADRQVDEIIYSPEAEKSAAEDIYSWQVVSAGGVINGTSADFILHGTAGQAVTGIGYANSFTVRSGFWQNFSGPGICCDTPGDANDDLQTNVGDAVFLINYIFRSGPGPNCALEGDANGDCSVNVGDAVYIISFCFNHGEFPSCGCP